ncbi:uncharacterized protein LOC109808833 [Cajanus cajan]|uniref:uncharacterized protein LOC109808833 n=1 Tax=Cajanus cajan TaxID=3821 RepID=UPI00098DCDF0|nr:uncharacterized protein LOC109808833 [Cajanus cajan]
MCGAIDTTPVHLHSYPNPNTYRHRRRPPLSHNRKMAKYDVAISTACPRLDYIMVETTNAAQACVELLRRENLGIATFMILLVNGFELLEVKNMVLIAILCWFRGGLLLGSIRLNQSWGVKGS